MPELARDPQELYETAYNYGRFLLLAELSAHPRIRAGIITDVPDLDTLVLSLASLATFEPEGDDDPLSNPMAIVEARVTDRFGASTARLVIERLELAVVGGAIEN